MDYTATAKPYAKATFNFAHKNKAIEQWETSLIACANICQDTAFREATQSPLISKEQLIEILLEALSGEKLPKKFDNFVQMIAQYSRYDAMPSIVQNFQKMVALTNKVYTGSVTSAIDLIPKQKEQVQAALAKKFDGNIKLNYHIDKSILGGLLIKMDDDTVFDASINSRISKLEASLIR